MSEEEKEVIEKLKDNFILTTSEQNKLANLIDRLQKENEELKKYKNKHSLIKRHYISKDKIKTIQKELKTEYKKNEEIFNNHFSKEVKDKDDYYIQKEATSIMQTISWFEGQLEDLLKE